MNRYTAIFQHAHKNMDREKEWFEDIFSSHIADEILDGEHKAVRDNVILVDAFIHANDPEYYRQFRGKNAFMVHFSDEFYEGYYQLYQNFRGVFRTQWASVFNPAYVKTLPVGYCKGMDRTLPPPPASARSLVWSFSGELAKSSRPEMAHAFARVEPHHLFAIDRPPGYIFRQGYFPERSGDGILPTLGGKSNKAVVNMSRADYQRILLDSIFCPSPMGSANLECSRTYEALECGSIPIVERRIGLDYYRELLGPHPLPTVRSWAEARGLVGALLESPERLDALQAECVGWWRDKKARLRVEVGEFLAARSADATAGDRPMYEPRANSNLWRCVELARHHDLRAAGRRASVMASRIIHGRRTRAAVAPYRPPGA